MIVASPASGGRFSAAWAASVIRPTTNRRSQGRGERGDRAVDELVREAIVALEGLGPHAAGEALEVLLAHQVEELGALAAGDELLRRLAEVLSADLRQTDLIARYGGGWRGLKPKLAHQHGAIGCIIYSDPRDDGYFAGDVDFFHAVSAPCSPTEVR